jgi:putative oxidoreductase
VIAPAAMFAAGLGFRYVGPGNELKGLLMSGTTHYPTAESTALRPMCSFLGRLHAALRPIGYPVMRIAVGLALVPHGWTKLDVLLGGHAAGMEKLFAAHGFVPAAFWVTVVALVEFFGGLMLAFGFLTRLAAVAVGIDLLLALVTVLLPRAGFTPPVQLVLMWGLMVFGIGCIGGGAFSVDALIGKEL